MPKRRPSPESKSSGNTRTQSSKPPTKDKKKPIEQYDHKGKTRLNNPPAGLVTAETDPDLGMQKTTYAYDPHLDPLLAWAGKVERMTFDVPTISLHVHERIDPKTIIEAVRSRNGNRNGAQVPLFETREENPPLREAIDFYRHPHGWSNRLIAGDSLLVMNSLLEKEGMASKVQMMYIDPPYGIRYGSNFQPFVNSRDVKDGKDEDLTQEPEMLKAFRDTWELGIHSYLSYLRDRLLLGRELLNDGGSIFLQINDENLHLVRNLLDEVFGRNNFVGIIAFRKKTGPLGGKFVQSVCDYLVWYARDKSTCEGRFRKLFEYRDVENDSIWAWVEMPDGSRRRMTSEEISNHKLLPNGSKVFRSRSLSPAGFNATATFDFEFAGRPYPPPRRAGGASWTTGREGMQRLAWANRLIPVGNSLDYVYYHDDFPLTEIVNIWTETRGPVDKLYAVQTQTDVVERCMLMTTDTGDLILDPTCGSGTTAFIAEQWGRRWIVLPVPK
jgi:adenine-specific DNA-methyltransferase